MSYADLTPETGTELTNGGKVGFVDCTAEGAAGTKIEAKWLNNLSLEIQNLIERAGATSTVEFNPANSETYRNVYNSVMALSRNYIEGVDYPEGTTVIIGTELFVRNSNNDSSLEVGWDGGYSLVSGTMYERQIGVLNETGIELFGESQQTVFTATYSARTNSKSNVTINTSVANALCQNSGSVAGNVGFGLLLKVTITNSDANTGITRSITHPIGQIGGYAAAGTYAAIGSIINKNSLSANWSGADVFHGETLSSGVENIVKGDSIKIEIIAASVAASANITASLQTGMISVTETEQ